MVDSPQTDEYHAQLLAKHEGLLAAPPRQYHDRAAALETWAQATVRGDKEATICLWSALQRWKLLASDATRFRAILRRFGKDVGQARAPVLQGAEAVNRTGYNRASAGAWHHARPLFEKAAGEGCASALNNLAFCYQRGLGGAFDLDRARVLYQQSSHAGCCAARVNLALLALFNIGGKPDQEAAIGWLHQAHAHGDADAGRILVYLVYAGRVSSRVVGIAANKQVAMMFAPQPAKMRPPWTFELRGAPAGTALDKVEWAQLRALGPCPQFDLWHAPLSAAMFDDEEKRACAFCKKSRLLAADAETQDQGCFACLAKKRFVNPEWTEAHDAPRAHTPTVSSWNTDGWFHHCGHDGVYLGGFTQEDFHYHAQDGDGRTLFTRALKNTSSSSFDYDLDVPRCGQAPGVASWLTFRCQICNAYATYADLP